MLNRINPVALVAGAASGAGLACARDLAARASGGLILVDTDEAALTAAADALPSPPERVSTLAFDVADIASWTRAQEFIRAQYGRIDWAVASIGAGQRLDSAELSNTTLSATNAVTPLMRDNAQGGALVLLLSAQAVEIETLLQAVHAASKQGATNKVRVNAVVHGNVESPLWRRDPDFASLLRDAHDEVGVLDHIARQSIPLVRCGAGQDILRLVRLLLTDDSTVSGATLAVDASPAL